MKITIDWSIRVPNFIASYIPNIGYKFFDVIVKVRTGESLSNKSVRTYLVKKKKRKICTYDLSHGEKINGEA